MTKVGSWGVEIMTKMGNMANIVKAASNCEKSPEGWRKF